MRYSLRLINKNGYVIEKEFDSIKGAKGYAGFYPLSVFFGWIYDKSVDEMIFQNNYTDKWSKCNNQTFVPYCL